MSAVNFQESLGLSRGLKSVTWLKNPSDLLQEVSVEPWGTTLYLLPKTEYAVITEGRSDDPRSGATVELADPITIWPEGTKSNRIHRADGDLVWDDDTPSEVSRFISAEVIAAAVEVLRNQPSMNRQMLDRSLKKSLAAPYSERNDLASLLIEHGILVLADRQGVSLPGHYTQARANEALTRTVKEHD